jgi:Uma2 family endonuclease
MRIKSADDVLRVPLPPGVSGYELVDGELVEVTPVSLVHGRIATRVTHYLDEYVVRHGIPGCVYVEAGYVLGLRHDAERLRAPDVSFVSEANLARHGGEPARGFARLVPELAVEVESPDDSAKQRARIRDFLEAGTRLVWMITPATRSATVYRGDGSTQHIGAEEALDGEGVVPGFRLALSTLFNR